MNRWAMTRFAPGDIKQQAEHLLIFKVNSFPITRKNVSEYLKSEKSNEVIKRIKNLWGKHTFKRIIIYFTAMIL